MVFTDFLKKEFSEENITFWMACEKYRLLTKKKERKREATELFRRHLGPEAPQPVNVDSSSVHAVSHHLGSPTADIFDNVQKQIFNLMKYDCYLRFLRSELFQRCQDPNFTLPVPPDKKRKSFLLPWQKLRKSSKNPEKSTQQVSNEEKQEHLCRVRLPDGSRSVVKTGSNDSVALFVHNFLEKRNFEYSSFQLFDGAQEVSQRLPIISLGCRELTVEPRVVFRLDVPFHRPLAVRADPRASCGHVVRPIVARDGLPELSRLALYLVGKQEQIRMDQAAQVLDRQKVQVRIKDGNFRSSFHESTGFLNMVCLRHNKRSSDNEEFVNQVFEDILQHRHVVVFDELGTYDLTVPILVRQGLTRRVSIKKERSSPRASSPSCRPSLHEKVTKCLSSQCQV